MKVLIAKVNETLYDADAFSARVPGVAGEMTILDAHMPLVSPLKPGTVYVRKDKDAAEQEFQVSNGIVEVHKDGVTILL
jgi:F-type H+-transporting ATPase subunit epsilon